MVGEIKMIFLMCYKTKISTFRFTNYPIHRFNNKNYICTQKRKIRIEIF